MATKKRRRRSTGEGEGEGEDVVAVEQSEADREWAAQAAETQAPEPPEVEPPAEHQYNTAGIVPGETQFPESDRPEHVTIMTPQGMQEVSTDPTDLEEYEGTYKYLPTGEEFGLKLVRDDAYGKTHHLKNVDHFWSGNVDEFRRAFEKQ
jgi:hypothetical protein